MPSRRSYRAGHRFVPTYHGKHRLVRAVNKVRRRMSTVGMVLVATLLLTIGIAWATHPGSETVSVEVADTNTSVVDLALSDGALVSYFGRDDVDFGSSGSGVFESYVQIQADPTQKGYNTDASPEFDEGMSATFNHSILLSEIPVVEVDGILYWEFFNDINDSNAANDPSAAQISLDVMELYLTDLPNITGYPFAGTADLLYQWEGHIRINDVNPGSGRGDLRYLVPLSQALTTIPDDCDYGNPACGTYLVHYSAWGNDSADYTSDSGFEEWKVKRYPILRVSKDIDGTFETPISWTIDKTDNGAYDAFIAGSTPTHSYTIDVEPVVGAPENAMVSGTITIEGDDDADVDATIEDFFDGAPATISSCSVMPNVDGTYTIPEDATVTCSYTLAVGDPVAGENEARAKISVDDVNLVFRGFASIEVADYTAVETGLTSVSVTDDSASADTADDHHFGPFTTSSHAPVGYSDSWVCSSDPARYVGDGMYEFSIVNTAVIDETSQEATATVGVTCHAPLVSKAADGLSTNDITWTIVKGPEGDYDLLAGESVDHQYTVTVDETVTAGSFRVNGTVTVSNSHPSLDMPVTIVDELDDGTSIVFSAPADCVDGSVSVPAGGAVVCQYSQDGLDGDEGTNYATVTFNTIEFPTSDDFMFDDDGMPTGPDSITVTDDNGTPGDTMDDVDVGMFESDGSTMYTRAFSCPTDVDYGDDGIIELDDLVNTASIDQTRQSDDATVSVTCYAPNVSKDAQAAFKRTYEWDILKDHDALDSITVGEGQSFEIKYDVVAWLRGWSDEFHSLTGTITISNPHPTDPMVVFVSDMVTDGTAGLITDCNVPRDGDLRHTVPAGGFITCEYGVRGLDGDETTNRGSATLYVGGVESITRSGDATIDWGGADITEIDASIDVTDEAVLNGGSLGVRTLGTVTVTGDGTGVAASNVGAGVSASQSSAPEAPGILFEYIVEVRDLVLECGPNDLDNTAKLVTGDLGVMVSASEAIDIDLACFQGCTLTQGYWKTHNPSFWGGAPDDETWLLLGPAGEGTPFFLSNQSYFDVMWTPPQGNVYYNLAHQYIAAELNLLAGADPTDIQDVFDGATALLAVSDPADIDDLKGKDRKDWTDLASELADYNEGEIGPGHCDEDGNSET